MNKSIKKLLEQEDEVNKLMRPCIAYVIFQRV